MGNGEFDLSAVVTRDPLSYLHRQGERGVINGPASHGSVNSNARANRFMRSSSLVRRQPSGGLPPVIYMEKYIDKQRSEAGTVILWLEAQTSDASMRYTFRRCCSVRLSIISSAMPAKTWKRRRGEKMALSNQCIICVYHFLFAQLPCASRE